MPATVLIVEDHHAIRQALRGWLEITFPGCHVIEAITGEEAIAMAQAITPQVIVIDVGLPGMNALEATACLKAVAPATLVVVLTSYEAEAQQAQAIANGAITCVSKHRITELQPRLAGLLST